MVIVLTMTNISQWYKSLTDCTGFEEETLHTTAQKPKWTNRDQSYFRKGNKQSLKERFDKGEFGALAMVTVAADLSLLAALSKAEICWGLKMLLTRALGG